MNEQEAIIIARRFAEQRGLAIGQLDYARFVDDEYFDAVARQVPGPAPPGARAHLVGNWFVSFECTIDPIDVGPIGIVVNPETGRARAV